MKTFAPVPTGDPLEEAGNPRVLLLSPEVAAADADAFTVRLTEIGATVVRAETLKFVEAGGQNGFDALVVLTRPGRNADVLAGALPEAMRAACVPILVATDAPTGPEVAALLESGAASDCLSLLGSDALFRARLAACQSRVRLRERESYYKAWMARERARADALLNAVIPLGAALTAERDLPSLLERILIEAQRFCNADSGSIYLLGEDGHLHFAIVRNESLGLAMGGTSGTPISFPTVPLCDPVSGEPNIQYVVAYAAVNGMSVNIADAYAPDAAFDFSGTRAFDSRTGYRSKSLLAVPLRNGAGSVIGVLQLLNALDWETEEIVPFEANMQQIIEALGRLAAVALEGYIREQRLTEQLDQLRIEIDQAKKARHVAEITETEYFQALREKSKRLRDRHRTD